jgi:hypothetical protein
LRRQSLRGYAGAMSLSDAQRQALREALYCEQILAKSGLGVASAVLRTDAPVAMRHYPDGDVYDPASGAQFYYHCHAPDPARDEHGHFHCFIRPDGVDGPIHHLIAVGIDRGGRLARLFTVNRWVTGDAWRPADDLISMLPRFDVQLAVPDYLANRWLTAVLAGYREEIAALLRERDRVLADHAAERGLAAALEDRGLEYLSERAARLMPG